MNDPLPTHYWIAEGTGELSARWLNPACDTSGRNRRHVTDFPTGVDSPLVPVPHQNRCPDCAAVAALIEARS